MAIRFSLLTCAALTACATYQPSDVTVATVVADPLAAAGGTFTFDAAKQRLLTHNPEILAADAELRAAQAVIRPLMLASEYLTTERMVVLMLDPLALLGLGERGGMQEADAAMVFKATAARVHVERKVTADLALAFATDAVLATQTTPSIEVDPAPYVAAGLAAPTAAQTLAAMRSAALAEQATLEFDRVANRANLRRLLGLAPGAEVQFTHRESDPPRELDVTSDHLRTRSDVWLAHANFVVADAEYRANIAAQWPTLMVGPMLPTMAGPTEFMTTVNLPLLRMGLAEAARERREVAHQQLRAAWLAAANEAETLQCEHRAMQAMAQATLDRSQASSAALKSATIALEVEPDAFTMLTKAATMAVDDARMAREARLNAARVRINAAAASGWPVLMEQQP